GVHYPKGIDQIRGARGGHRRSVRRRTRGVPAARGEGKAGWLAIAWLDEESDLPWIEVPHSGEALPEGARISEASRAAQLFVRFHGPMNFALARVSGSKLPNWPLRESGCKYDAFFAE